MMKKQERLELLLSEKPRNLKGKAIGLWHRDHATFLKEMKKAAGIYDIKLTKKQRKELKKIERAKKLDEQSPYFRIGFDLATQKMISNYLESVANKSPTFLIPLNKYHTKIKKSSVIQDDDETMNISNSEETIKTEMNIDNALLQAKQLQHNFLLDLPGNLSLSQIQSFLKFKNDSPPYDSQMLSIYKNIRRLANASGRSSKSPFNERSVSFCDKNIRRLTEASCPNSQNPFSQRSVTVYNRISHSSSDDGIFDSIDKYKHLEETPFKRNFLRTLSQSIQNNLNRGLKNEGLQRIRSIDITLYNAWKSRERKPHYQNMLTFRKKLPSYKMRSQILDLINDNQVVLISGETGCGKTTQVAQFILDHAIEYRNGSICNVICTQPRRISAISVAQRVADERVELLGKDSVGYQIRLEKKIGRRRGSILFCTTGILLQFMQSDPALKQYSHIVLDEIHERDTLCDFALTILKDVAIKRTDLKIILMSATLNAEQFSKYFNDCPSIIIPGYTFPVKELYLEDVLEYLNFQFPITSKEAEDENFKQFVLPYAKSLEKEGKYSSHVIESLRNPNSEKINTDLIVDLIEYICDELGDGAILIFVPGWEDINSTIKKINNKTDYFSSSDFTIIPLHSMLPTANQKSVFDRPPLGVRKIVIATNIAETSITIDDVVFVIDCGKIKIKNYDVANNISTLKPEFVSLANARQRKGRAGRVQSGYCFHLFSRGREAALTDYPLPEMLRTRLEEVILHIKLLMMGKVEPFLEKVMDPPDSKTVHVSMELLRQLNAIDKNENLTPLGFHLAKLPLDPQIGKMILLGAIMSCLNPVLSIAAGLSFKDPFYLPLGEEKNLKERKLELDKKHKSDHLILAEVMTQWDNSERNKQGREFCSKNYLTRNTLFQLRDLKAQFAQYLYEMGFLNSTNYKIENLNMNSNNHALTKAVICAGLYPNVAIIKKKTKQAVLLQTSEDNGTVKLHPKSVNTVQTSDFETKFMVYHEKLKSTNIFIYDSTMISSLPLLIHCSDFFLTYPKKNKAIIHINKDLIFACDRTTAHYITELKLRLNWLLEYKLSHPGQIMWKDDSSEIALLKTLTDLFTNEHDTVMRNREDSSDES